MLRRVLVTEPHFFFVQAFLVPPLLLQVVTEPRHRSCHIEHLGFNSSEISFKASRGCKYHVSRVEGMSEDITFNSPVRLRLPAGVFTGSTSLFGFGLGNSGGKGPDNYDEENVEGGREKGCLKGRSATKDVVRLEFLYPAKTLAFLRYFSMPLRREDHEYLPPGTVFSHGSKRLYTTVRKEPGLEPEIRFPDAEAMPEWDERFISLQHLQGSGEQAYYDQAWYHYLNEKDRGNLSAKKDQRYWMLSYLQYSDRRIDKERIVTMFQHISAEKRTPDEYSKIVIALLDLGMIDAAFSVLKTNVSRGYSSKLAGFEQFIAHCIDYDFGMAVKAWELLESCPPTHPHSLNTTLIAILVPNFKEKFIHMAETMQRGGSIQRFVEELLRGALESLTSPQVSPNDSLEYKHIWDLMQSLNMEKRSADYEHVLFHLYRHQDFVQATDIYLEYREFAGIKPSDSVLNAALRAFREQLDWKGMQLVFDDWFAFGSQPDQQAYYILMKEMARRGESGIVKELVGQFFERFELQTVFPYNHLMQAHTIRGELEEVVKVFNTIKEVGLTPDRVSHNILINAHAKANDVDGALNRVQDMYAANLKPDEYTFTTLITMASERGDIENTKRLFDEAMENGFEPNNMMYAALIAAHVSVDDIEAAETILEKVEDNRAEKPESTIKTTQLWNNLLAGYASRKQTDKLNTAYHRMRNLSVPFDEYTYGIIMHSLCLINKVEAAYNILQVLQEEGFQPSEIHYSILMVGHMSRRDTGKVWDTFREMRKQEITPQSTSLALLIQASAFLEHSKWRLRGGALALESANEILVEVTKKVEVLDLLSMDPVKSATPPWLFTPLVSIYGKERMYAKALEKFEEFLNLAHAQRPGGTRPTLKMYIALMNAHMKANNTDGVRSTWESCKRLAGRLAKPVQQSTTNTAIFLKRHTLCSPFSIFIKAMSQADDLTSIDIEMQILVNMGYEFDNNVWNDYVQAFTIGGDLNRAFTVCEKKLMPGWPGRKGYYYTQASDMKPKMPTFYPFIRTLETMTTELRQVENSIREGNRVADGLMKDYDRNYPRTLEACQNLIDKEPRIAKEVAFRIGTEVTRDGRVVPWGRHSKRA
ncbi:uncharacterized protein LAJ45_00359 [Morchella importuna]|uniref:uncharacterized protein n=1 Tax=Morchella importuna TaxID=1174673 RepID=UPI001E8CB9D6|nr:uncharacterized protein LAJ45_00359 [Morchella importuna]KAH8155349.1 hypothetical protein LAJ45_00359 [Morchella importuna]